MKIINKLFSLIICLAIIATLCPAVYAEETLVEDYSYEISVLKALGFIDQDVLPENTVTRADMAKMVAKLYPVDKGFDSDANKYFNDVDPESDYYNAVNILVDWGVVSKADDMLFHPEREVEPNHAVKMLVSAMGLDFLAVETGGYPVGYNYVAIKNKIVSQDSFYADNTLCFGEVARAIYNVLMSKIDYSNSYDGIHDTGIGPFMSKRLGIYFEDGIFTGNSVTTINSVDLIQGCITVDGVPYYDGQKYENLIGERVRVFYKLTDGERHVLYMCVKDPEASLKLDYYDIVDYNSGVYVYSKEQNNKTQKAILSPNFEVIYNNKTIVDGTLFTSSMMKPVVGDVKLIDNTGDGVYDVAVVWNYSMVKVESFDSWDGIIYGIETNADGETSAIIDTLDENIRCDIYFESGDVATVSNVMLPGTLLDVAISADEEYCKIVICKKMIRGTVKDITEEFITIDEEAYTLSPYFSDEIKVGNSYDFYFNHKGTISYCKKVEDNDYRYGFVIDAKPLYNNLSMNIYIKLYSDENFVVTQKLSKKVRISDTETATPEKVLALLKDSEGNIKRQIIKYKLNNNGEFKEVRVFTDEQTVVYEKSMKYHGMSELLDNKYPVAKTAKVFLVGNPVNEDTITAETTSIFGKYNSPERVTTGYASDSTRPEVIDVLMLTYDKEYVDYDVNSTPSSDATVGGIGVLVEKVSKVLVGDRERCELEVWCGRTKHYIIAEDEDALKFDAEKGQYIEGEENTEIVGPGDYIKYGLNINGRISQGNVVVVYDCDRDNYRQGGTGNSYSYVKTNLTSSHSITRIWGYNNVENWYMFSRKEPQIISTDPYQDNITTDDYVTVSLSQASEIIVFDRSTGKTHAGTINDIVTLKQTGVDYSNGIMYCYQANPSTFNIYLYK